MSEFLRSVPELGELQEETWLGTFAGWDGWFSGWLVLGRVGIHSIDVSSGSGPFRI